MTFYVLRTLSKVDHSTSQQPLLSRGRIVDVALLREPLGPFHGSFQSKGGKEQKKGSTFQQGPLVDFRCAA